MDKKQLIDALAKRTGFTKVDCGVFLEAFVGTVLDALSTGEYVKIVDFGIFKLKKRAPRIARNIASNEAMSVPESIIPVFQPGKKMRSICIKPGGDSNV